MTNDSREDHSMKKRMITYTWFIYLFTDLWIIPWDDIMSVWNSMRVWVVPLVHSTYGSRIFDSVTVLFFQSTLLSASKFMSPVQPISCNSNVEFDIVNLNFLKTYRHSQRSICMPFFQNSEFSWLTVIGCFPWTSKSPLWGGQRTEVWAL